MDWGMSGSSDSCYLCACEDHDVVATQADLRFFPEDEFRVVRCKSCGLLYTLPKLCPEVLSKYYPPDYGDYADDVEGLLAGFDPSKVSISNARALYGKALYREILGRPFSRLLGFLAGSVARAKYFAFGIAASDALPNFLPFKNSPGTYLHIGAGSGGRFVQLLHEGWKVSAIDVNKSLMERWGASPSLTTFGQGIRSARFPDATFDIIHMSHVIEHLSTPVEDLGFLNRWLKADGVFVCVLPLYGTLGWDSRPAFTYYDVPRHTMHFSMGTLSRLLGRTGFRINKVLHLPYSWGFYFSDFKRYCLTGRPRDCTLPTIEFQLMPIRHKLLGYFAWALRSSGNVCVYATKCT